MALESEEIGLIAAGCVCFLFILSCTVLVGLRCWRHMERVRAEKLANQPILYREPVVDPSGAHTASRASSYSGVPYKLGSYTPKIFGTTVSQDELLMREGSAKGRRGRRRSRQNREPEIQTTTVDGKVVSVVNVNQQRSDDENDDGRRPNGHGVYAGYVVKGYMVEGHIVPEVPHFVQRDGQAYYQNAQQVVGGGGGGGNYFVVGQGQGQVSGAEVVRGHYVTPSEGGGMVRSHVLKQNVSLEEDGKVLVTLRQEGSDLIKDRTTLTQRSMEDSGYNQQGSEVILNPMTVQDEQPEAALTSRGGVIFEETAVLVREQEGGITFDSEPETIVEANGRHVVMATAETDVANQGETIVQTTENYRVIRKDHHGDHVRLPNWMVKENDEDEATMLFDDFADDDDTNNVVRFQEPTNTEYVNARYANAGFVIDEGQRSEVGGDDEDTGATTVMFVDYVDPQQQTHAAQQVTSEVGRRVQFQEDATTTMTTTTDSEIVTSSSGSVRQVRQMFDDSAERVPATFTSTPRFADDIQGQGSSGVVSGVGRQVMQIESRRQRSADDLADILPPPPPPHLPMEDRYQ